MFEDNTKDNRTGPLAFLSRLYCLLTSNIFETLFLWFYCWLSAGECRLGYMFSCYIRISFCTIPSTIWPIFLSLSYFVKLFHVLLGEWNNSKTWKTRIWHPHFSIGENQPMHKAEWNSFCTPSQILTQFIPI